MREIAYFTSRIRSRTKCFNTTTNILGHTILELGNVVRNYKTSLVMRYKMDDNATVWNPFDMFESPAEEKYAVFILNRPIYWEPEILIRIWENAQVTVTVDGGTQRWITYLKEHKLDILSGKHNKYVPNLITGDLDSSPLDLLEKLKILGSEVIKTPDQNYTDYTKALMQLQIYCAKNDINLGRLYVFADTSGRLDHIIGNINTLHKADKYLKNTQIIQVANNSLAWILKAGVHRIIIPQILVQRNSWCGLLPFGSVVNDITTTGLKWNLNHASMQFGDLVSSSNTYDSCSEVTIATDTSFIWSMGIEPLLGTVTNGSENV